MSQPEKIPPLILPDDFPPATVEQWRAAAEKLLKGAPFEKVLLTKTYEDITLQPIYHARDIECLAHADSLPGEAPYLRGTLTGGYLSRPWQIAQRIPASNPKDYNEALRHDLENGQDTIVITLDSAEPGQVGLPIQSLQDLQACFTDVNMENYGLIIHAGSGVQQFLNLFKTYLIERGIDLKKLHVWINFDPIGDALIAGKLSGTDGIEQVAAMLREASSDELNWNVFGVKALHFHDAGASAVQEIAFGLAQGLCYLRELESKGVDPEMAAGRLRMSVGLSPQFFLEIAKVRALRMLWAEMIGECGIEEETRRLAIHGAGSFWHLTRLDPYVNMLRGTTEAFAGVLAGCDSLEIWPFDAAIRKPDEFSRRIARNTQIILREECHLNQLIDPPGGAWYVERLTTEIAEKAWELFREIEAKGGFMAAAKSGWIQTQVAETAQKRLNNLAYRKDRMVGVNMYPNVSEKKLADESKDAEYRQSVSGEASGEVAPIRIQRGSAMFESLREAMQNYVNSTGSAPKVYLAPLGRVSQYRARVDFSRGFFEVAGFNVIEGSPSPSAGEAAKSAADSGALIVVACSSDDLYPEIVPDFARDLKARSRNATLVLAGYPKEHIDSFREAGVDELIHLRANAHQLLSDFLKKVGVSL